MGSILILLGMACIAVLGLSWLWPRIRGLVPSSVQAVGDRVDTAIDKATASAALETLVRLYNERGDTATVITLGNLWVSIWAWQPPAHAEVSPKATLADLASQLASLQSQLAVQAKTTSEIPAASLTPGA